MSNPNALSVDQANKIAISIGYRQEHFGESLHDSIMVVLLNCGDQFTRATCIKGEWSGTKADLQGGTNIPKCPNGHVLIEDNDGRKQLGWVDEEPIDFERGREI